VPAVRSAAVRRLSIVLSLALVGSAAAGCGGSASTPAPASAQPTATPLATSTKTQQIIDKFNALAHSDTFTYRAKATSLWEIADQKLTWDASIISSGNDWEITGSSKLWSDSTDISLTFVGGVLYQKLTDGSWHADLTRAALSAASTVGLRHAIVAEEVGTESRDGRAVLRVGLIGVQGLWPTTLDDGTITDQSKDERSAEALIDESGVPVEVVFKRSLHGKIQGHEIDASGSVTWTVSDVGSTQTITPPVTGPGITPEPTESPRVSAFPSSGPTAYVVPGTAIQVTFPHGGYKEKSSTVTDKQLGSVTYTVAGTDSSATSPYFGAEIDHLADSFRSGKSDAKLVASYMQAYAASSSQTVSGLREIAQAGRDGWEVVTVNSKGVWLRQRAFIVGDAVVMAGAGGTLAQVTSPEAEAFLGSIVSTGGASSS
jgi:hypothetical protein